MEEAGGCCSICGYDSCIVNLHFHHVDPNEKAFILSSNTTKALDTYRDELDKRVLVCANCHGEIEAGLRVSRQPERSSAMSCTGPDQTSSWTERRSTSPAAL